MSTFIGYLDSLQEKIVDEAPIEHLIRRLDKLQTSNGTVFVCGNGGSYSTAQHFVEDLNTSTACSAIQLGSNPSYLTAIANDHEFEDVYASELKSYNKVGPEVFLLISTSGKSKNMVKLAKEIQKRPDSVIFGLTGIQDCPLFFLCDHSIVTPAKTIYQVESIHSALLHYVIERLRENG